jgi:hypothetical protein
LLPQQTACNAYAERVHAQTARLPISMTHPVLALEKTTLSLT